MTVLQGTNPHQIAVARSLNYTGPWDVNPQPIVTAGTDPGAFDAGEVVAPSVLIEGNKVRLWFHGVNKNKNAIAIGYAESSWPLIK
jgi:beta-xylosidase